MWRESVLNIATFIFPVMRKFTHFNIDYFESKLAKDAHIFLGWALLVVLHTCCFRRSGPNSIRSVKLLLIFPF